MAKAFLRYFPVVALLAPALASADVNQPKEIIDRPLTTPAGQITASGELTYLRTPDGDGTAMILGGQFGVNEKLAVGVAYSFLIEPRELKGDLGATVAYSLVSGGNLDVAANAFFGYYLYDSSFDPLALGAEVRFKLNDRLSIYTPGEQLSVTLEGDSKPIELGLPVGVGLQATPEIFAYLETTAAVIGLSNSDTTVFGADYVPLAVGAFFSPSNTMDFGAQVNFTDLKNSVEDALSITGAVRLHL